MRRFMTIFLTALLLAGLLSGCISGKEAEPSETGTQPPAATPAVTIPVEIIPMPDPSDPVIADPSISIEPIPDNTDDSDYQLPPGERSTLTPEDK